MTALAEPVRRVAIIYGTRPEAIKVAPLLLALGAHPRLDVYAIETGQHRAMVDEINAHFGLTADIRYPQPTIGIDLPDLAVELLQRCTEALRSLAPDGVVVQGDTTSAAMGALAAFYLRIPVVHLEAGLRTGDLLAPYPEEANRRLIAPLASLHLAPTRHARNNLLAEGIGADRIVVTGNTVIDALLYSISRPSSFTQPGLDAFLAAHPRIVLVTAHRRESWGPPLRSAMLAVQHLADRHADVGFVLPMHPNPTVRVTVQEILGERSNVLLVDALPYPEFCSLMNRSFIILTDSGGVQEEAPSLGKPVLVMRDVTERVEALEAGTVRLVGTRSDRIIESLTELLGNDEAYERMARAQNPYGDGLAASRSAAAIGALLGVDEFPDEFDGR